MTYENAGKTRLKESDAVVCFAAPVKTGSGAAKTDISKTYHDFRASLNIIIGYSELMLDGVLGKMTDEQRAGVKDILNSSLHVLDLVNEITGRQASARS